MSVFGNYEKDVIQDTSTAEAFLRDLITETKGLFILDFLDNACWDCVGSLKVDSENDTILLNWHRFVNSPDINEYTKSLGYSPSISSVMLHFKDLTLIRNEHFPCFTIRGYALKKKEIETRLKRLGKNVKPKDWSSPNFYTHYDVEVDDCDVNCHCYNAPIYSILAIPKNSVDNHISVRVLYHINYIEARNRLVAVFNKTKNEKSEDEIRAMANTVRSIFEFILKIECCYSNELHLRSLTTENEIKTISFKKDYSDLKLGELVKLLRPNKTEDEIKTMNKIATTCNELSHDSGKPVSMDKLYEVVKLTLNHIDSLIELVR